VLLHLLTAAIGTSAHVADITTMTGFGPTAAMTIVWGTKKRSTFAVVLTSWGLAPWR